MTRVLKQRHVFNMSIHSSQNTNNIEDEKVNHLLVVPPRGDEEHAVSYEGNQVKEKAMAFLGAVAATGLIAMTVLIDMTPTSSHEVEVATIAPRIIESTPKPPVALNPYRNISLKARAAIVYDVHRGEVIYGLNEERQMPLASLTKMMTALLAVESFGENENLAVAPHALMTECDTGLFANETWNVHDLVSFTMLTSSNDGAGALAAAAGSLWSSNPVLQSTDSEVDLFVQKMNTRAAELGLMQTRYTNPTGLDEEVTGGLGSAEDMAKLLTYIWENEPDAIRHTNEIERDFVSGDAFLHTAKNTNEYVNNISGLIGSKTGFTDMAGGNLAVMYDAGMDHPLVVVVLGSTLEGRFEDVETLVDATYGYVETGWYEYDMKVAGATPEM